MRTTKKDKLEITVLANKMEVHGEDAFVSSRDVAKRFGVSHKNLMRKIRTFDSFDMMIEGRKIEPLKYTYHGQEYPYFEMDRDAFMFIGLSMTGKKAERFKWLFIEAFKLREHEVITLKATIAANLANGTWVATRRLGKETHRSFTDVVKAFCKHAEKQRGRPYGKTCHYYRHFSKLINATADIRVRKGIVTRNGLAVSKLDEVRAIEDDLMPLIEQTIAEDMEYHRAFKYLKKEIQFCGL